MSAIELGPTNPLPRPWLIRTRASRRGVVAKAYRKRETESHRRPISSGSFRPIRSAMRPKNRFAGAWTREEPDDDSGLNRVRPDVQGVQRDHGDQRVRIHRAEHRCRKERQGPPARHRLRHARANKKDAYLRFG